MNIVVLAGGLSPERDVSLNSGSMVANALISNGHKVLLIDLYKGLKYVRTFDEAYDQYKKDEYIYPIPDKEPDLDKLIEENGNRIDWLGENVISICKTSDSTFLALHGAMGENGQLQSILEAYGIKFTGTNYLGSAIAMDKQISKEILSFHKVTTPPWQVYETTIEKNFTPFVPCIIKPISCGSSIGISLVETEEEFEEALSNALNYDTKVLVEKKIEGREFTVSILNGEVLEIAEIIPKLNLFDYKSKYQKGLADEICPAEMPEDLRQNLKKTALKVHKILHLGDYSRIDFIANDSDIYCLEANTLPGMTPTSVLPRAALACDISYIELCEELINLALKR